MKGAKMGYHIGSTRKISLQARLSHCSAWIPTDRS